MRNKRMYGSYTPEVRDGHKRCSFCGEWKPFHAFAKNGVDKYGHAKYRDDCKVCYNIRRRENATKKRHSNFVGSCKRRGETDVNFTHHEWKDVVIFFGGECAYCGKTMKKGERLTRDHLVPVSEGGKTTQDNIVPACKSCNSSKGATEWRKWFMQQPFFSQERMNKIYQWRSIIRACGEND